MPSVNVVNGKQIVVISVGPVERVVRFFAKPFVDVVNHSIKLARMRKAAKVVVRRFHETPCPI